MFLANKKRPKAKEELQAWVEMVVGGKNSLG
jgi:hypothetical protein